MLDIGFETEILQIGFEPIILQKSSKIYFETVIIRISLHRVFFELDLHRLLFESVISKTIPNQIWTGNFLNQLLINFKRSNGFLIGFELFILQISSELVLNQKIVFQISWKISTVISFKFSIKMNIYSYTFSGSCRLWWRLGRRWRLWWHIRRKFTSTKETKTCVAILIFLLN